MKVKVTKWRAVANWRWEVDDDCCGICRMPFDACCPDCSVPGDECPPVWGTCTHAFHMHCIVKWLESSTAGKHCPLCRAEWNFR